MPPVASSRSRGNLCPINRLSDGACGNACFDVRSALLKHLVAASAHGMFRKVARDELFSIAHLMATGATGAGLGNPRIGSMRRRNFMSCYLGQGLSQQGYSAMPSDSRTCLDLYRGERVSSLPCLVRLAGPFPVIV